MRGSEKPAVPTGQVAATQFTPYTASAAAGSVMMEEALQYDGSDASNVTHAAGQGVALVFCGHTL